MMSQSVRTVLAKRLQHAASTPAAAPAKSTFTNKYNFDLSPPQTHKYWNMYNSSVVFGIGLSVFALSDYIYGGYFEAVNAKSFSPIRRPLDNSAPVRDGKFA